MSRVDLAFLTDLARYHYRANIGDRFLAYLEAVATTTALRVRQQGGL